MNRDNLRMAVLAAHDAYKAAEDVLNILRDELAEYGLPLVTVSYRPRSGQHGDGLPTRVAALEQAIHDMAVDISKLREAAGVGQRKGTTDIWWGVGEYAGDKVGYHHGPFLEEAAALKVVGGPGLYILKNIGDVYAHEFKWDIDTNNWVRCQGE